MCDDFEDFDYDGDDDLQDYAPFEDDLLEQDEPMDSEGIESDKEDYVWTWMAGNRCVWGIVRGHRRRKAEPEKYKAEGTGQVLNRIKAYGNDKGEA